MPTSSARPQRLHRYASTLDEQAARVLGRVDTVSEALRRYQLACAGGPSLVAPHAAARDRLVQARSLADSVNRVADAFAAADSGGGTALSTTNDVALSDHIAAQHPGIATGDLLAPRRALEDHGRATGRRLRYLIANRRYRDAEVVLRELPDASTRDPGFGAALLNQLPPRTVIELYGNLSSRTVGGWREPGRSERILSRLHNAATHTWETPSLSPSLGRDLVEELARTTNGRNTLRALLGTSALPAGTAYLDRLVVPLLLDHDAEDDGLALAAGRSLTGADGRGDGDAAVLAAVGRNPVTAVHLVSAEVDGHPVDDRVSRLYAVARRDAQDELAGVLDAAVRHPELAGQSHVVERGRTMNRIVEEVAADPGAVGEPLATWLAETTYDDSPYWTVRSGRGTDADRAQATAVFEAVASHDRSFVTATTGLQIRERRCLAGAVKEVPTCNPDELGDIASLTDQFEEGAKRADRPEDRWNWAFAVADRGLDLAQVAVPAGRAAKAVVRPIADAGLSYAHEQSRPGPGHRAAKVEAQTLRRRRNAWVAMAQDGDRADLLVWAVGDSSIHDVGDLRRLAIDADAQVDLGAWERAQPTSLQERVDELVTPH